MEFLGDLFRSFTSFVDGIVDYIKNLVATIRKFNDEHT